MTTDDLILKTARKDFFSFILYTFPNYNDNFHHKIIADEMQLAFENKKNLVINVGPQHGKSLIVSRLFPAYLLGRYPSTRIAEASYSDSLSSGFNRDCQSIMESENYLQLFPESRLPKPIDKKKRTESYFELINDRGYYKTTSIGGSLTGFSADVLIIDDPYSNREQAESQAYQEKVHNFYDSVAKTRLSKNGIIIIVQTIWTDKDLAKTALYRSRTFENSRKFIEINFPAIAEGELHHLDPRKEGEALWSDHKNLKDLEEIKAENVRDFYALYQGRPRPTGGTIIKEENIQYVDELPTSGILISSTDTAFKDKDKNDYNVITDIYKVGVNYIVNPILRKKIEYSAFKASFKRNAGKYLPYGLFYTGHILEDSANASALNSDLKYEVEGIILKGAKGSKETRLHAISGIFTSNNVFFYRKSPIVEECIHELLNFPSGLHDDFVDTVAQGIAYLKTMESNNNDDNDDISYTEAAQLARSGW